MEVIATRRGYHGSLREPDEKFDVPEGSKASWFKPTGKPVEQKAAKPGGKNAEAKQPAEKPGDDLV